MREFTRLFISNDRLRLSNNNFLELTKQESHYLNKVMRIKLDQEILIINGQGSLWKAKNIKNNRIEIINLNKPLLFQKQKPFLLGLATSIPKNGFENILKMATEIGIDIFQPLITDRQIKRFKRPFAKTSRWDSLINESVEQCERLWKPKISESLNIFDWIPNIIKKDFVSISATRIDNSVSLKNCLKKIKVNLNKKDKVFWNVIGPEGGWSHNELDFFIKNKIQLVKLSDTILRTSTAAISSSFILNEWRNDYLEFNNFKQ
tara:strand:- start:7906 stop:8691 length:786 start_codon:yes stop_codon:yes gene_type:complete